MQTFSSAALLCFLLIVPVRVSFASLLVDDCEGTATRLAEGWASYADAHSSVSPLPFSFSLDGYNSSHCAGISFELKAGEQYPYAGLLTYFKPHDLGSYEGIRFWVKGEGDWSCQIPTSATSVENNHYSYPLVVSDEWVLIEIPFSFLAETWGTKKPWDVHSVTGVQWSTSGSAGAKGWIRVDLAEFYKKGEAVLAASDSNPILKVPKVNQLGYCMDAKKYFAITEYPGLAKKGDTFRIVDTTGKSVFSGSIQSASIDDSKSTGERVFLVDFRTFTKPGRYAVEVNGIRSASFEIGPGPYTRLYKDALRSFYVLRCGTAVDDPVTGIKHPACHLNDAPPKANGKALDLAGGWHNADDYGKWVIMESISCSWMMWLYELKEENLPGVSVDISESNNKIPDILDQAKWGLDWMLKMQNADGSVLHKVDGEDHFCHGTPPEADPFPRYFKKPGSIDAADFVGTMCLASRAFRADDPGYSDKCFEAAKKAWAWLEQNPNVVERDPDYIDLDPSQERLWALGEMARMTGDPALLKRFDAEATPLKMKPVNWAEPQFFGYMAQIFNPETSVKSKEKLVASLAAACDELVRASDTNGYGVVTSPAEYYWESNETLLTKTNMLLVGFAATGKSIYMDVALRQMNWLLGVNSLGFSFVAGYGERSASHPWHWSMSAYGKLLRGWVMGGPNRYTDGADMLLVSLIKRGTPPAKCYIDANNGNGSWAANEGETSETAALVFAAGFLSGE